MKAPFVVYPLKMSQLTKMSAAFWDSTGGMTFIDDDAVYRKDFYKKWHPQNKELVETKKDHGKKFLSKQMLPKITSLTNC